jgi:uncharacterized Zn finger protein
MTHFSRTWWGQRFLAALEQFTDPARLGRGRSYARGGRILEYAVTTGRVTARVRGSINPYFGVYKEPIYRTTIQLTPISEANWTRAIARLGARADLVTRLLLNEMPDSIEETFGGLGLHLLPHSEHDFTTECSCPDWANPCKHIAGVYYRLAASLDHGPFLLFELRGLSRSKLRALLARSPLGQVLAASLTPHEVPLESVDSYFTRPDREPVSADLRHKEFWTGAKPVPPPPTSSAAQGSVPAVLIKKAGDYPPFWQGEASFLEVMEALYERVRTKSEQLKSGGAGRSRSS